jgi:hypothetical protein
MRQQRMALIAYLPSPLAHSPSPITHSLSPIADQIFPEPGERVLAKLLLMLGQAHRMIAAILDDEFFGSADAIENIVGMRDRDNGIIAAMHDQCMMNR